eukprot:TRINITY_DN30992_c0_g1_i1.p1 TRINITY_DN30992_c0_g1~~TRINITY_DN30992_c0_g1_i1.p1  ORF type:complete len:523 (-),score=116.76 TRINITY_DN30992_c0_g1_i1:10-1578(-)
MFRGTARRAGPALQRFFVVATSGLEQRLLHELQSLGIPGRLDVALGGVLVTGPPESLWRVALESRVAESARLLIGEPFHAPDVKALDAGLKRLPWDEYVRSQGGGEDASPGGDEPEAVVKAISLKSRLFHTHLLEERVKATLKARGADSSEHARSSARPSSDAAQEASGEMMEQSGGSSSSTSKPEAEKEGATESAKEPPTVMLYMRNDQCQVSIAATGALDRRGYRQASAKATLKETLAAACVHATPFQRRLTMAAHADEELVLWDPFCDVGLFLTEALGIAMGAPPGLARQNDGTARLRQHPFLDLPCHDAAAYDVYRKELQARPHPSIARLRLVGSNADKDQVQKARGSMRRFLRRLGPEYRGDAGKGEAGQETGTKDAAVEPMWDALPCRVQFLEGTPAQVVREMSGKPTMILASLPYSEQIRTHRDGRRNSAAAAQEAAEADSAYAMLGRLLNKPEADWRDAYVISGHRHFVVNRLTGMEWTQEGQFFYGDSSFYLLRWTGSTAPTRGQRRRTRRVD